MNAAAKRNAVLQDQEGQLGNITLWPQCAAEAIDET
jgi:hypothetical protein